MINAVSESELHGDLAQFMPDSFSEIEYQIATALA
jgi:hypothetical protein